MKYTVKKIAGLIITLLIVSMLAFLAFELIPGRSGEVDPRVRRRRRAKSRLCGRRWDSTVPCRSDMDSG